ncbi:hypothetical protein Bca101_082531 [Brassica carinata]
MPSFELVTQRLLPPSHQTRDRYTHLTHNIYRAMGLVGHKPSGETTFRQTRGPKAQLNPIHSQIQTAFNEAKSQKDDKRSERRRRGATHQTVTTYPRTTQHFRRTPGKINRRPTRRRNKETPSRKGEKFSDQRFFCRDRDKQSRSKTVLKPHQHHLVRSRSTKRTARSDDGETLTALNPCRKREIDNGDGRGKQKTNSRSSGDRLKGHGGRREEMAVKRGF